MKVWVTRDKVRGVKTQCHVWHCKPILSGCRYYGSEVMAEPAWLFKRHHGFTPRKGSCKQMELSLKEIT